jgi:hypothetical protein
MKKMIFAGAALAGALALGGCKDASQKVADERAELNREQVEASRDTSRIRAEAAKDKAEIDREAARDVADERKEVAEQSKDVREAERDMVKENVREGDGTLASSGVVSGRLGSTVGQKLTIRESSGKEVKLGMDDRTSVTRDGQTVKIDDFKEGTEVRASYVTDGDDRVAREVQVLSPAFRE